MGVLPEPSPSDEELLVRMAARDEQALAELYRRHHKDILDAIHQRVGNRDVARDLAQETFIRAYRRAETYRAAGPARAWLHTIARNAANSHLRVRSRRRTIDLADVAETDLVDADADAQQGLLTALHDLEDVLDCLQPLYRRVIDLYLEGKDPADIAAIENITVALVRSRLAHAKRALKKEIRRRAAQEKRRPSRAVVAVLLGPSFRWASPDEAAGPIAKPAVAPLAAAGGAATLAVLALLAIWHSCINGESAPRDATLASHSGPSDASDTRGDARRTDASRARDASLASVPIPSPTIPTPGSELSWASLDGVRGIGPSEWVVAPGQTPHGPGADVPWDLRVTGSAFTLSHERREFATTAPSELRFEAGGDAPIAIDVAGAAACSAVTTCAGTYDDRVALGTCTIEATCAPAGSERVVAADEEFLFVGGLVDRGLLLFGTWRQRAIARTWHQVRSAVWSTLERRADLTACRVTESDAPLTMREAAEAICPSPGNRACEILRQIDDFDAVFPSNRSMPHWTCPEGVAEPRPIVER